MASAVALVKALDEAVAELPVLRAGEVASRIALVGKPDTSQAQAVAPLVPEAKVQVIVTEPLATLGAEAIPSEIVLEAEKVLAESLV